MRLRACMLAIAVVTPLRAFAQTPAPADAPPPPAAAAAAAVRRPPPPPPPPPPAAVAVAAAPMALPPRPPAPTWKVHWSRASRTRTTSTTSPGGPAASIAGPAPSVSAFDLNSNTFTLNYARSPSASTRPGGVPAGPRLRRDRRRSSTRANGRQDAIAQSRSSCSRPTRRSRSRSRGSPSTSVSSDHRGRRGHRGEQELALLAFDCFFNIPLLHSGVRANYKVNDSCPSRPASSTAGTAIRPTTRAARPTACRPTSPPPMARTSSRPVTSARRRPLRGRAGTPGPTRASSRTSSSAQTVGQAGVEPQLRLHQGRRRRRLNDTIGVSAHGPLRHQRQPDLAARGEYWPNGAHGRRRSRQPGRGHRRRRPSRSARTSSFVPRSGR